MGASFEGNDPSTGNTLGSVADASPADGMRALQSAARAPASSAALPPRQAAGVQRVVVQKPAPAGAMHSRTGRPQPRQRLHRGPRRLMGSSRVWSGLHLYSSTSRAD